jgi:hypothetical protein
MGDRVAYSFFGMNLAFEYRRLLMTATSALVLRLV